MTALSTWLARLKLDAYILAIVAMVVVATVLPAQGAAAVWAGHATRAAVALVFFLNGARLSRQAVVAGMVHWRLQLLVLAVTFGLFPLMGLAVGAGARWFLPPALALGMTFLSVLPSTVQSSIAFTAIARGNVSAAVCAATVSNLAGVLVTPLWVGAVLSAQGGGFSWHAISDVVMQLLVPFVAGQVSRPWLAAWAERRRAYLGYVDRGSVLLVVYVAFSEGVTHGIWHTLGWLDLGLLLLVNAALLAAVLGVTTWLSRRLGFGRADEIAIVFCGSKKSLASGVPMANILFPASVVSSVVLPLMLFHQIQLMACAVLAQRYARQMQGAKHQLP